MSERKTLTIPKNTSPWQTVKGASKLLGVSEDSLTTLVKEGKIPFLAFGAHEKYISAKRMSRVA